MSAERPAPRPDADSRPYWEAAARGELVVQQCSSCATKRLPGRVLCPACWSDESEWVAATGRGTVYTFTMVHRAPSPAFADRVPYIVALIELEEGPRVVGNIVEGEAEHVRVGAPVSVRFERLNDDIALPQWALEAL
jgi:hypothetical protein